MSSRDTEGRREIEAAQRRLAAAQAHASAAAKTVETANETKASAQKTLEAATNGMEVASKNADAAYSQLQSTQKEVKEAKKFLKEAEKRWEVIEVESDDEAQQNDGSSKRRKVSVSPPSSALVEQIVVEGCGTSEANGIYKRDGEFSSAPQYTKEGRLAGKRVVFEIFRQEADDDLVDWDIMARNVKYGYYRHLYTSSSADRGPLLPPANGWEVDPEGVPPAPQLKLDCA